MTCPATGHPLGCPVVLSLCIGSVQCTVVPAGVHSRPSRNFRPGCCGKASGPSSSIVAGRPLPGKCGSLCAADRARLIGDPILRTRVRRDEAARPHGKTALSPSRGVTGGSRFTAPTPAKARRRLTFTRCPPSDRPLREDLPGRLRGVLREGVIDLWWRPRVAPLPCVEALRCGVPQSTFVRPGRRCSGPSFLRVPPAVYQPSPCPGEFRSRSGSVAPRASTAPSRGSTKAAPAAASGTSAVEAPTSRGENRWQF